MSAKRIGLLLLLASAVTLSIVSCRAPITETPSAPEAWTEVVRARDAALTYVRGHFEDAPAESLSWVEEKATPEDAVGGVTWQYTAWNPLASVFI